MSSALFSIWPFLPMKQVSWEINGDNKAEFTAARENYQQAARLECIARQLTAVGGARSAVHTAHLKVQ